MTERSYDPNPTVDSRDPQAYAKYAERLDRDVPEWWLDDPTEMAPGLAEQALQRRITRLQTRPRIQPPAPPAPPGVFLTPMQQGAVAEYELLTTRMQAGFSREEAMTLLRDFLRQAREHYWRNEQPGGGS